MARRLLKNKTGKSEQIKVWLISHSVKMGKPVSVPVTGKPHTNEVTLDVHFRWWVFPFLWTFRVVRRIFRIF